MDTSEVYIKMCSCPEIQDNWKPRDGDYYYWSVEDKVLIAYTEQRSDYIVKHPEQWDFLGGKRVIWLPRQDQIQAMFDTEGYLALLGNLEYWMDDVDNQAVPGREIPTGDKDGTVYIVDGCDSFEQLWLAFYMDKVHGLIWTDGKWEAMRGGQDG